MQQATVTGCLQHNAAGGHVELVAKLQMVGIRVSSSLGQEGQRRWRANGECYVRQEHLSTLVSGFKCVKINGGGQGKVVQSVTEKLRNGDERYI